MTSIKTYSLFVLLFITFSCKQEADNLPLSFNKTINTDGLQTFKIPPVLLKERIIVCTDDFFVTNSSTEDTVFRVFDLKTLNYLGGFGKSGEAPENYNPNPSTIYSPYGNTIHVGSTKKNRILNIFKDQNNASGIGHEIIEEFKTPGELIPFNWSSKLNDTTFVGDKSFNRETELAYYTTTDRSTGKLIPYPEFGEDLNASGKYIRYQKKMRVSRDRSKIVMAYVTLPLLRIYDVDKQTIKNIFIEVDPAFKQTKKAKMLSDGLNINSLDLFNYYINVYTTDNHIYAQMLIQGYDEITGKREMIFPSELHVFDLEGEPKLKITLEDWMFVSAASQDDQYVYFWNSEIEDELYKLPIGSHL